ncbi:MAG: hypothetical protein ACP5MI_11025 [Candidatus Kryptoniota bacterium]
MKFYFSLIPRISLALMVLSASPIEARISHSDTLKSLITFQSTHDPLLDTIIVAKVAGVKLTAKEYLLNYLFGPSFVFELKNPRHALLDAMVDECLFSVAARDSIANLTEETAKIAKAIQDDIATEQLYRKHIWDTVRVSDSEIREAIKESMRTISFRWIYSPYKSGIDSLSGEVSKVGFDSVYRKNDIDSTHFRSTDFFHLKITSPEIYEMDAFARQGDVSEPVKGPDGYYIFKIDQLLSSPIITKSEYEKRAYEIREELRQYKADVASDEYVDNMLKSEQPIIKRDAFNLLSGYIGSVYLSKSKFNELGISKLLMTEAGPINAAGVKKLGNMALIEFKSGQITLGQFLEWFHLRSFNFKFSESNINVFLHDVESYVWRMLRDQLLIRQAHREGMYSSPVVLRQMERWKEKLSALAMINHIISEINLDTSAVFLYCKKHFSKYKITGDTLSDFRNRYDDIRRDYLDYAETERLLHTSIILSRIYPVTKYYDVVDRLNLPGPGKGQPIEVEYFKTGGTFPRKAFPTIEEIWSKIIY